ncbi:thiosulfate oxidation carrier complex protein SoxZ [Thiofaba sp. EF100]|jgi:sulfur-oxidizing protein SoxZ|uniref:thiosulfate oxidation carrier complex protein SoxZ n=1 Tax=Thiofaba sp. EF100 TaxID=3121274 RepID=UPI003221B243
MAGSIKIRASVAGDMAEVKCLITHPMEPGNRKDKTTGADITPKFITEVTAEVNGKVVLAGNMSAAVSKNPFLSFKAPAKAGDKIKVSWKDNTGESDSEEAAV